MTLSHFHWTLLLAWMVMAAEPPAVQKGDENREWVEKERTVLVLERQALNREMERLEQEKKEWEITQRAQALARQLYRWDPVELPPALKRRDGLNRIISEHFSDFLNREAGDGKVGKLILLKIQVNKEGAVSDVTVEKSELPEPLEKKIVTLAKKLGFSSLGEPLEPFDYRFPLVIQR